METIEIRYRRSLKRKNFSPHTIKNYMHSIHHVYPLASRPP